MKKVLAITLSLLMLISLLAACGDTSSPGGDPGTTPPVQPPPAPGGEYNPPTEEDDFSAVGDDVAEYEPDYSLSGTLKVWYDNDTYFEEMRERFNALYPNITIEYERVAHTDARGRMQLDGPAGIGADVFMLPHDHIGNAILDGLIEPIDESLQKKLEQTLSSSAVKTVKSDGYMYAVPMTVENIALFYNKDLWGPNPPATMEEIITFAQSYNDPAAGKWTMGWQIDDAYHNYHWQSAFGMEFMGPDQRDYKNPGFDSPGSLEGIKYMMYLRENLFDVPSGDAGWSSTVGMFQQGELPLTITGPWAIADAARNGVNFGVTKLPTIDGRQPICFHGIRAACMSSYTTKPDLAMAFLDFLASVDGADYFYNVEGMLPAILDQSQVPGLSGDTYLAGIMQQNPFTIPMPLIPELQMGGWDGLRDSFVFAWDGQLTAEESQVKAMDTYKLALQAAGKDVDF